jgi:ubiquitin-like domain-containing CTD phosphatase 1
MADEDAAAVTAAAADAAPPPPPAAAAAEGHAEPTLEVLVKWSGAEYSVRARPTDTVAHLKRELQRATAVDAKRLKLLGLKSRPAPGGAAGAAGGGCAPTDDTPLADLALRPGQRLMMMGQRDEAIAALEAETARAAAARAGEQDSDDDGGVGGGGDEDDELPLAQRPEIQDKLRRRIEAGAIDVLHPPRAQQQQVAAAGAGAAVAGAGGGGAGGGGEGEGAAAAAAATTTTHPTTTKTHHNNNNYKCLVLDIDYTLFDLGSSAERPEQLARPYLHEFLERCYRFYGEVLSCAPTADKKTTSPPTHNTNPTKKKTTATHRNPQLKNTTTKTTDIVIWSATSVKWVQVKMRELGVLGDHGRYRVTALMDCRSMLTVPCAKRGTFDCKPLQVLWARFPGIYTPENTVMLDDLRRNFVLNPQNGLTIRPFRHCHTRGRDDQELVGLADYLELVGARATLADLDHARWERYLVKRMGRLARLQRGWGGGGGVVAGGSGAGAGGAGGGAVGEEEEEEEEEGR